MKIIDNLKELDDILDNLRQKNIKIGLIPTMGGIHKGHLFLVENSIKMNCFSIVSIFVNPTQFNDLEDFKKYPQSKAEDISSLGKVNCNLLYLPKIKDLYPKGLKRKKTVLDFRNILCDKFRPGHFDGVTTVINNLFKITKPDLAFFGEKDFQQLKIIQSMVSKNNLKIKIYPCQSIRLQNGMSYSTRNRKLSLNQKKIFNNIAKEIYHSIDLFKKDNDLNILKKLNNKIIDKGSTKIDYLEIRDEKKLLITNRKNNARLFIAFYIDQIRIIDNFLLY